MRLHAQKHPQAVKHLAPAVFRRFACAAGRCPDSCCRAGWEIVVDPQTLARYRELPGPEGSLVRSAVCPGREPLLRQDDARVCLLLDSDGLCRVQKCFGHESLCRVCREYPRFRREFGGMTEHGLSLSCPTAYALAVSQPPLWEQWEDDSPIVPNDLDPERYLRLREGRELALDLLTRAGLSLERRLALVGSLTALLQKKPGRLVRRSPACRLKRWQTVPDARAGRGIKRRFDPAPRTLRGRQRQQRHLAELGRRFLGLEILSPAWKDALQRFTALAEAGRLPRDVLRPDRPEEYARWLWYSLYKYWLDALDDGKLLARVERSLAMLELGLAMDRALPGEGPFLRRISREIEHCEENLAALLMQSAHRNL